MELKLICKWGMDGSTGHSPYKQSKMTCDDQLFVVSMVPLRLVLKDGSAVIWANHTPSSPRFCRPISIQYTKESTSLTAETARNMDKEIDELLPLQSASATVSYELYMTMVDGKVVNAVTGTPSSQTCSICGATP